MLTYTWAVDAEFQRSLIKKGTMNLPKTVSSHYVGIDKGWQNANIYGNNRTCLLESKDYLYCRDQLVSGIQGALYRVGREPIKKLFSAPGDKFSIRCRDLYGGILDFGVDQDYVDDLRHLIMGDGINAGLSPIVSPFTLRWMIGMVKHGAYPKKVCANMAMNDQLRRFYDLMRKADKQDVRLETDLRKSWRLTQDDSGNYGIHGFINLFNWQAQEQGAYTKYEAGDFIMMFPPSRLI